jgi:WD40 repeat protein
MRRARFTIGSLLGLILFSAVSIAALRESTDLWESSLFSVSSMILLGSILLAVHRIGHRRAFWLGFALFGWVYLVASLVPPVESRLLTTKGLQYLDSQVRDRIDNVAWKYIKRARLSGNANAIQAVAFSPDGRRLTAQSSAKGIMRVWDAATGRLLAGPSGTSENFLKVGHSILALVLAFLGGHLSRFLDQKRRDRETLEATLVA